MLSGANEEIRFFVYLPEYYAYSKGRNAGDVLREWDAHGITQEIYDGTFSIARNGSKTPTKILTA